MSPNLSTVSQMMGFLSQRYVLFQILLMIGTWSTPVFHCGSCSPTLNCFNTVNVTVCIRSKHWRCILQLRSYQSFICESLDLHRTVFCISMNKCSSRVRLFTDVVNMFVKAKLWINDNSQVFGRWYKLQGRISNIVWWLYDLVLCSPCHPQDFTFLWIEAHFKFPSVQTENSE